MTSPTKDQFVALARSSPWRWATLRFTASWVGPSSTSKQPLRAWVRRPDALRVETMDGQQLLSSSARPVSGPRVPLDPAAPQPEVGLDGLVVRRPPDDGHISYDDPMYQNYAWVAMLDPVELADGQRWMPQPTAGPVEFTDVRDVIHHNRPAWEAVARPTASYDPRCSCCALLFAPVVLESGLPNDAWPPGFRFPEAHRVRLDVATGVCVFTEELDGERVGAGHDVTIEAVDEPMPEDLFPPERRRWWRGRP